jgi:hypothetical protein
MFAFSASGSSSTGSQTRSTKTTTRKGEYVPSTYIKRQLELEEEESRRQREQGEMVNGRMDASSGFVNGSLSSSHWRGPEEVLAPGYRSGALGYHTPAQPSFTPTVFDQEHAHRYSHSNSNSNNGRSVDNGAGVGLGVQGVRKESISATAAGSSKLYPDLHGYSNGHSRSTTFADTTSTSAVDPARHGVIRSESRVEVGGHGAAGTQNESSKKNSVRFSATATTREIGSPRPGTPSIYSQGGATSPFFTGSSSSLHTALKEDDKIDILGHRAAATTVGGASALNSSLGPALGSVSGATGQSYSQAYSSPTRIQGDLNMTSLRSTGFGSATGGAASSFLGHDGSALKQAGKSSPMVGKNGLGGGDEEDKDKERYMPAVLLNYTPGMKVMFELGSQMRFNMLDDDGD